jgi:hypothetical protein
MAKVSFPNSQSADEASYLKSLDQRLSRLGDDRPDFQQIVSASQGAFPTVVAQRLSLLGLDYRSSLLPDNRTKSDYEGPELHPLDCEYYFIRHCASDLAKRLAPKGRQMLCLGAPTVAAASASMGVSVKLIDQSPLITRRFPEHLNSLEFVIADLNKEVPAGGPYPVVFFDAPWYPEVILRWLWYASQVVDLGGIIAFTLFPPLLRPGAPHQRSQMLQKTSELGTVEVMEGMLVYETPPFEETVFEQKGIKLASPWRRGDLVVVQVARRATWEPPQVPFANAQWDSYVVGRQVVKLRKQTRAEQKYALAPLKDFADYIYPVVSRRDVRRREIDLWTSRNRIARVGRREIVAAALSDLVRFEDSGVLRKSNALALLDESDREAIILSFRSILGV